MFFLISCASQPIYTSYVLIGLTAHTLPLSQLEMMRKLPYDVTDRIDARTIELR